MSDSKGYMRGAKGIDGNDGVGYDTAGVSKSALVAMYGRGWAHQGLQGGKGDITGEKGMGGPTGHGRGDSATLRSAKQSSSYKPARAGTDR